MLDWAAAFRVVFDIYELLPRALRATTRRADVLVAVAARAVDVPPDCATSRDCIVLYVAGVPDVTDALRAVAVLLFLLPRGMTRRGALSCSVRVITLIGLEPWDGVTPGFRSVRIWLLRYGYM